MSEKIQIVIVGGGTAGITVAAQLLKTKPDLDVTIIEPSEKHYYQPMWTLVGGGIFQKEESQRNEADYIPQGVNWVKDFVESLMLKCLVFSGTGLVICRSLSASLATPNKPQRKI